MQPLYFRFLNYSITPGAGVRKQDSASVISIVANNAYGRDLAFDFVRSNWRNIKE